MRLSRAGRGLGLRCNVYPKGMGGRSIARGDENACVRSTTAGPPAPTSAPRHPDPGHRAQEPHPTRVCA